MLGSDQRPSLIDALKAWARNLTRDVVALWIAARDRRVAWQAKAAAGAVAAYALSPIDLIPDFIPLLGYLDDSLIIPAGIWLVVRLIPPALMAEFSAEADRRAERPKSIKAGVVIVALWIATAGALMWSYLRWAAR